MGYSLTIHPFRLVLRSVGLGFYTDILLVVPSPSRCLLSMNKYGRTGCSVCADMYAPGLGFSCRKCDGSAGDAAMATGGMVAIVIIGIVALILKHFARRVDDDDTDDAGEGACQTCKRGLSFVYSFVMKSFPLTAFKTVIVVWQVVTQVSSFTRCVPHATC